MRRDVPPSAAERRRDWLLAATVLLSSWLLFQVQPMAGKRILPWFGGGPAVWATAMLFFQAALLAGYLYAHLIVRRLAPRSQAIVHSVLLAAAVVVLATSGVIAGDGWQPAGGESPQPRILAILAATVGLPYLMLAATAPLVQTWWARRHDAGSPYRLYALSNFGSLAGLLSYPLAIEPRIGLRTQAVAWSALFVGFAVLCALGAFTSATPTAQSGHASYLEAKAARKARRRAESQGRHAHAEPWAWHTANADAAPTKSRYVLWLALPACASALLLAVTNYLCQDVASLPLMWVAPLAVYLVTFIIAFEADRWYVRPLWLAGMGLASLAAAWSWQPGPAPPLANQVAANLALLLTAGMVCHGEVARLRPPAERLTAFYICLSAGGVLGGLLVAVLAPLTLGDLYELPLATLAAWLLAPVAIAAAPAPMPLRRRRLAWLGWAACGALLAFLAFRPFRIAPPSLASARNFFGVLKVQNRESLAGPCQVLMHGRITHGAQLVEESLRDVPTTYYARTTGVGQLIASLPTDRPRRVGVVGLGAGTLAAYAQPGDVYRFYDIDPQVIAFAERYFTFLSDARERGAEVTTVVGDARLALEHEPPQEFDVLAVDAFSGDAIPVHLLTLEAFEIYLRHVRDPGGALAIHVSNRHLDLAPIVQAAADRLNLEAWLVSSEPDRSAAGDFATWALLTRRRDSGAAPAGQASPPAAPAAWTDDYTSIWNALRKE